MPSPETPWLDITEAAGYAKSSRRVLYRAVAAGTLRAFRVGGRGRFVFRREDLDAWVESCPASVVVVRRHRAASRTATTGESAQSAGKEKPATTGGTARGLKGANSEQCSKQSRRQANDS